MRTSATTIRRLSAACAAVGVAVAIGASAASAAVFSPAGPIKQSGTLTWELNGGSPVSCPIDATGNTQSGGLGWQGGYTSICSNGATISNMALEAVLSTSSIRFGTIGWLFTPFSTGQGSAATPTPRNVPFVNGDAATPSQIVFSDTVIGTIGSQQVSVTGTLDVTTPTGGLVTLN